MGFDLSELPTKDGMYLRDALHGEFTDVDDASHTVQVIFPHDTVDTYKTTFDKDAFRESFAARLPLMCWQHDLKDPIGHALSAQVTPRHNELVGQFSVFDAVPNSKRAFSQIKDGTITDTSFGFRAPKYEPHPLHRGVRNVRSAMMMEFSPVSIGSIPGAIATGLREEEFMSEHSVAEITQLVEAKLISVEAGQRMLAEIPGLREHITIVSPEAVRVRELEALLLERTDPNAAPVKDAAVEAQERIAELEAELREAKGETAELTPEQTRIAELEEQLRAAGVNVESDANALPDVLTADAVVAALPEDWQRAIREANAVFAIAPEGTEFFRTDVIDTESASSIATNIEAAHQMAADWMKDIDVRELPEGVQQAIQLWNAAGVSNDALLDVLNVEERAATGHLNATDTHKEPITPMDSENMAPTKVKCLTCGGSGESEDGKTCPTCMGSGIVAMTRDDMPDDAPDNASKCPTCKGSGKIRAGHMKCPDCRGKGWMTREDVEEAETRADASQWSTKPWSDFKQSSYSNDEWKRACLIVDGDGSTKDQCKLPVREPDGTYNVNGIEAAAGRINQVTSDGDSVADAADALVHLYSRMGKDVPPEVTKLAHRDDMDDVESLEQQRQAALDRLARRGIKEPEPVA